MCYHVQLLPQTEFQTVFEKDYELIDEYDLAYHLNGFNHPYLPVITMQEPGAIQLFQWGLIPHWAQNRDKAAELQNFTLNATCEHIFEKPSFRDSALKKRCVIPVGGFFENRHEGKLKYPYFIFPAGGEKVLFLGGLYSQWVDKETGEVLNTCTIITTPANALLSKIHNTKKRMPLIFTREATQQWLNPELLPQQVKEMMLPGKETLLAAHTISRLVNQGRFKNTNVPEVSEPVAYPELNN